MSNFTLIPAILQLSVAKTWDVAVQEWVLDSVYEAVEFDTCLCGHYPIREICTIRNTINGKTVDVGNCCVKKFMGINANPIFAGLKRVRKDIGKSFNAATVAEAFGSGWINDWEWKFYLDVIRKTKLSPKQLEKKIFINKKILSKMVGPGLL